MCCTDTSLLDALTHEIFTFCVVESVRLFDSAVARVLFLHRRAPRSTRKESSAASDVYKRQVLKNAFSITPGRVHIRHGMFRDGNVPYTHRRAHGTGRNRVGLLPVAKCNVTDMSLLHISELTRQAEIADAVYALKKKTTNCSSDKIGTI